MLLSLAFLSVFSQQKGKASYYSKRATGARTSSGQRLHHDSLTCAHRTHPFGTKLLVKNLSNGKEVIVTVTDRGPHTKGRVIDLTYEAARRLDMLAKGVTMVEVSVYHPTHGVPYREDPDPLPEFEFESLEKDSTLSPLNPVWKNKDKGENEKSKSDANSAKAKEERKQEKDNSKPAK